MYLSSCITASHESSGNRWEIKLEAQQKKGFDSIGVAMLPSAEYRRLTVDSNIAYIKLRHFNIGPEYPGYQDIFADIQKRKLKTLVIDLRGNPGGNLVWLARFYSHMIDSPKYFYRLPEEIKKQKQLYNNQKMRVWVDKMSKSAFELITPHPFTFKGKIYVLIDGGTFSVGSLLAANLKALKNVTFVGEETGGSKNVWTALTLKSLSLPTSQLLLRYGTLPAFFGDITNIDGRGVMPDVPVAYGVDDYLAGKDLELDLVLKDIKMNIKGG
ncbi:Peptidase family S41 [Pedobacter suwonensis]|uniref:Peptidase family S41 n=1 Tax=Pedobacter suwonensis TaxID=332999 RepID=A0A1I0SPI0_9SPHI|nr:S41 family peptidase [Pedobacter suwonensis]SFA41382.1 Peptidase family S41 [Pedobacter suwonensis]